jgi:hypothetical protein
MSAGERDMSDNTEIWGPCGHNSLDFACYAAGVLDDEIEARAVGCRRSPVPPARTSWATTSNWRA